MLDRLKKSIVSVLISLALFAVSILPAAARVIIEEVGESIFPSHFMPSEGAVGALVIPVEFIDFRFQEDPVSTLEEMFSGSGTAYAPSVADYFYQASYGEMQLDAQVQPVVRLDDIRKAYSGNHTALIEDLLQIITDRGVNLHDFDKNEDGILDGLYIIWAGAAQSAGSDWWPYSDTFYFEYEVCGIRLGSFSCLSYELMNQDSAIRQYTAIHETGHQLGLTDYYVDSYTSGTNAAVMMDRNEGDEDCFSKTLLGWIEPQIVTSSSYVTLQSASVSDDAVLVAPESWNGNYLSEYFMAEYVTPEANQWNQPLSDGGGVRIWHVSAATSQWTDEVTASMYRNDNSGDGAKLLSIVDASQEWYGSGDKVREDQTVLYSGENSGIAIQVESIENGQAKLCISYFGEMPAKPEESESSVSDDNEQDSLEDTQEYDSTVENEEIQDEGITEEEEMNEEAEDGESLENVTAEDADSEGIEEVGKKELPQVIPVLFVIALGILIFVVLKGDKKRKNKRKRKRKK